MNYQEIDGFARGGQEWAIKLKAKRDAENENILVERQAILDTIEGIRVGDFVKCGDKIARVAHHWGDRVQLTDGRYSGSFYLGRGYISYSGSLNSGIEVEKFHATNEVMEGNVWFFSQDHSMAHNGYYTKAQFKVWTLEVGE